MPPPCSHRAIAPKLPQANVTSDQPSTTLSLMEFRVGPGGGVRACWRQISAASSVQLAISSRFARDSLAILCPSCSFPAASWKMRGPSEGWFDGRMERWQDDDGMGGRLRRWHGCGLPWGAGDVSGQIPLFFPGLLWRSPPNLARTLPTWPALQTKSHHLWPANECRSRSKDVEYPSMAHMARQWRRLSRHYFASLIEAPYKGLLGWLGTPVGPAKCCSEAMLEEPTPAAR